MKVPIALGAALLALTAHAGPPTIGYAQATGYFKKDSRPTLYQPLNLLDNREITVWCSTDSDPLKEKLFFGFKGVAKIDEIRVYTGNGADDTSFSEFSRAKKFSIRAPSGARTFTVQDQRGLQAIQIRPPLKGDNFTIEILDQYPAEDPESPVCVTDIVFYSDGKPLNGPWLTPKLKYDRIKSVLLGTWYAGYEGAPEKFLSFYFDNSFRYVYEPIDTTTKTGHTWTGDVEAGGGKLVIEVPGKGKLTAHMKREKDGDEVRRTLVFEGGDKLPEDFKEAFRDHP